MKTHLSKSITSSSPRLGPHLLLMSVLGLACLGSAAQAETYTWTGSTNSLLNGVSTNWNPEGTPGAGDALVFNGAGTSGNLRVGTGVNPVLGGQTGLASLSITAGQTAAVTFIGQASAGQPVYRFDVNGSVNIASGAGAVAFGGSGTNMGIALGGGTAAASGTMTFTNQSSNAATIASNVTINRGGSGTGSRGIAFGGSGNWNVSAAITGVDFLNKTGGGTLSYSGTTSTTSLANGVTVSGGTLLLTGTLANSASTVTISSAGTLSGTGSIAGATVLNGTLSPGMSPGTLTLQNNLTLGAGANLNWQIHNATGAAGSGYDLTDVTNSGSLLLSSLSSSGVFNINLWSLSAVGPDTNGNVLNFDNTLNYEWTLFRTGNAITGFDENLFQVNVAATNGAGGFTNNLGGGSFSVALGDGGTDLVLRFTAIPEPQSAVLLLGVIGLMLLMKFRKRLPETR